MNAGVLRCGRGRVRSWAGVVWGLMGWVGGFAGAAESGLGGSGVWPGPGVRWDFDRDGVAERVVWDAGSGGEVRVEVWNRGREAWEAADYGLPEGVVVVGKDGADAGLRFVDLNQDGYPDVLFSNAERYAIHLWNKDVKPHLGWMRGWSQEVRRGERRGREGEPPSVVGATVRMVGDELVIERAGAGVERVSAKRLVAFDAPPPRSVREALEAFRVRDGFRVECVASEPVVVDPVSFDWGADGRFWVVEMRDYPMGMDGRGKPGGVVKRLEDRDGDGIYEAATTFLDGLAFPTSVMAWKRGVLVAVAPDLIYAEDTDGDGRADRTEVVLTGFAPGNQQHRFNGFEWGLDGWVHVANGDSGGTVRSRAVPDGVAIGGRDLRVRPDTGEFETVSVQTQYGRRRDDWGNWFGNNNATWLWQVTVPEHYLRRNPALAVRRVSRTLANYDDSTRVFPVSEAQVRPNQPWSLNHVTSGCSPSPYRDDLFGPGHAGSVFICEPVHNVVHREVVHADGSVLGSRRAAGEEAAEFLASEDNWFRPVTVRTGPDGALYIADMYRLVLEHPEWISPEMLARVDVRAGEDRGRIYRVSPEGRARREGVRLDRLEGRARVEAMNSPSGWQRDWVQRLMLERRGGGDGEALRRLLGVAYAPQVRVQALSTLGLLGELGVEDLLGLLADPSGPVRVEALRWSETKAVGGDSRLFRAVAGLAGDGEASVRLQAAFSLGAWPASLAEPVLRELAARDGGDEWIRVAVMSSLRPGSALFAEMRRGAVVEVAAEVAGREPTTADRAAVVAGYAGVAGLEGDAGRGRVLFEQLCSACHRMKGLGHEVGPDLGMVGTKPLGWLLVAILDPGAAVEARYRGWALTLGTGDVLEGLISGETANNVVLRQAGGVEHAVLRSDIAGLEPLKGSLMPGGLEAVLPPQGMADLVRWLREP